MTERPTASAGVRTIDTRQLVEELRPMSGKLRAGRIVRCHNPGKFGRIYQALIAQRVPERAERSGYGTCCNEANP